MPNESLVLPTHLEQQFDDVEQQREASTMGMWLFLATEVLFFGAMFLGSSKVSNTRTKFAKVFFQAAISTSTLLIQHRPNCSTTCIG